MMEKYQIEFQNDAEDWQRRDGSVLTKTRSGKGYKPGGSYGKDDYDMQNYDNRNVNMGNISGIKKTSDNPLAAVVDFAKGDWNDPKKK